jgi:mannose-6-phosphate isomerase-like protein (cupin superfamily)
MKRDSEKRPWGMFERFCENETCTVKTMDIRAGAELSLQYHRNRDEFWKILSGEAIVTVGEQAKKGEEGDEFHIPRRTRHRIKACGSAVKVLEISFGEFDESDVVRLEDRYGRA